MIRDQKYTFLPGAILCSFALMVFSFFIRFDFPFRFLAFAALLIPAWIFSKNLKPLSELRTVLSGTVPLRIILGYLLTGILCGMMMAIAYRLYLGIRLIPDSFHFFALVAALIGCTEEIVFRGFLQESVRNINAPFSILFSTISHTGYKCCLFLSPMVISGVDIGFLALWTFIAGIAIGTIKHISGSILPPVIAHAIFDILVYASFLSPPWWVW